MNQYPLSIDAEMLFEDSAGQSLTLAGSHSQLVAQFSSFSAVYNLLKSQIALIRHAGSLTSQLNLFGIHVEIKIGNKTVAYAGQLKSNPLLLKIFGIKHLKILPFSLISAVFTKTNY